MCRQNAPTKTIKSVLVRSFASMRQILSLIHIWSFYIFGDFSLYNKLFGCGPDTFATVFEPYFEGLKHYGEMCIRDSPKTKKVYSIFQKLRVWAAPIKSSDITIYQAQTAGCLAILRLHKRKVLVGFAHNPRPLKRSTKLL